ncbi:MAG: DUF3365 domain-containing protein [Hyphomonadaceae bacterium]|nr:DUF3365 domain-containing protein [Hyphomonadaceae bacterium]
MLVRNNLRLMAVAAFALAAACSPEPEAPSPADMLLARQAGFSFDVRLKMEILDRLERDEDPVAVYLAYRDHVPSYAKEIGERLGFEFSRVSTRPRNPSNAADDWEAEQMELFGFWRETGLDPAIMEASAIVEEGDRRVFRWMRPLVMDEPCMTCHGDTVDQRILKLLAQEYPLDEATGYYETEIGGAYSVTKALTDE